jgi:hypothetical protein
MPLTDALCCTEVGQRCTSTCTTLLADLMVIRRQGCQQLACLGHFVVSAHCQPLYWDCNNAAQACSNCHVSGPSRQTVSLFVSSDEPTKLLKRSDTSFSHLVPLFFEELTLQSWLQRPPFLLPVLIEVRKLP